MIHHSFFLVHFHATIVLAAVFQCNTTQGSCFFFFQKHVFEQLDQPVAGMPLVIEPLDDEILSGIEEDVSFIRDGKTSRKMSDPAATLERHL